MRYTVKESKGFKYFTHCLVFIYADKHTSLNKTFSQLIYINIILLLYFIVSLISIHLKVHFNKQIYLYSLLCRPI